MKLVIPNDPGYPMWKRKWGQIKIFFDNIHNRWYQLKVYNLWAANLIKLWMFLAILGSSLIVGFFSTIYLGAFGSLPNPVDLKDIRNNLATEVYAVDSSLLGRYYFENRSFVPYERISKPFIHALVSTEDARYFRHDGQKP